jgi:Uma2 family endonuclease
MNLRTPTAPSNPIVYPESDGKPMADNTRQFRWIQVLHGNIAALFRNEPDVFVAGDLLCYPEEGHPEVNTAPDVLVVFGRPKGDRRSYKQWEEGCVPLTVVFEILSPTNTVLEMAAKFAFYEDHGVEEYYIYDPDNNHLQVFQRRGEVLVRVRRTQGFVSPRLGIRFDLSGPEMVVLSPDGRRFCTFEELEADWVQAQQRAQEAERRAAKAEQDIEDAERRAAKAEQDIEDVQRRAARQTELMRRALRQQATADELQELEQLLKQPPPS